MTENPSTALVRAALASGASAGEYSLVALAKEADDAQLAVIVGELPADDILALALEADMTKVSMVHLYATPEQMLAAFERIGSNWSQLAKIPSAEDYLIRRQDMEDFLCPMMFGTADEARAKEMMKIFSPRNTRSMRCISWGSDKTGASNCSPRRLPHRWRRIAGSSFGRLPSSSNPRPAPPCARIFRTRWRA